jgi:hypothetical protein
MSGTLGYGLRRIRRATAGLVAITAVAPVLVAAGAISACGGGNAKQLASATTDGVVTPDPVAVATLGAGLSVLKAYRSAQEAERAAGYHIAMPGPEYPAVDATRVSADAAGRAVSETRYRLDGGDTVSVIIAPGALADAAAGAPAYEFGGRQGVLPAANDFVFACDDGAKQLTCRVVAPASMDGAALATFIATLK